MKNKVVLLVLIIFTAFSINASDFSQGEGTIGVTFATNSNIDTIKYYADALKTTLIDSSSRIEMKEGDTIYVSFNNSASNFYDFLGFDLYWYDENGKRKEAPIRINSTSEIVLPSSSEFYSEISVEPYGKFKDRTISFSDSVDGIEIDNEWKINDETYTGVTSASINAVIPYSVSYRYDPNLYYIKSVSPENRIIVAGNGSIIFFEETPSSSTRSNNLVTNYSVQIKPYVHVSLPDSNLFTRDRIKRIVLSNVDKQDIEFLRSIQYRISKPRLVSMLIWQNYVQPLAKKKFPLILGSNEQTGIYKITNIKNQLCYVGQAVNVYKRWNDHLKAALGIDTPQGNKLYQAMVADGIDNFTFELLETCEKEQLNEKEQYYIDLYNSVAFGYNSQSGIKGK